MCFYDDKVPYAKSINNRLREMPITGYDNYILRNISGHLGRYLWIWANASMMMMVNRTEHLCQLFTPQTVIAFDHLLCCIVVDTNECKPICNPAIRDKTSTSTSTTTIKYCIAHIATSTYVLFQIGMSLCTIVLFSILPGAILFQW